MKRKYRNPLIQKIEDLSLEYKSDSEISKILDISRESVRHMRRSYKIKSGERLKTFLRRTNVKKLHETGLNISEISRILNVPDSTIAQDFKSLNLKSPWTRRSYINDLDKIKGYMIRNVKHSAKRRNLEFNLEYTDIELPLTCPILNVPLAYKGNFQDPFYATIDRIDNSKGYIKGNIMVLSRLANCMKNSATNEQLKTFCINITKIIENQGALGSITDIFPDIKLLET